MLSRATLQKIQAYAKSIFFLSFAKGKGAPQLNELLNRCKRKVQYLSYLLPRGHKSRRESQDGVCIKFMVLVIVSRIWLLSVLG